MTNFHFLRARYFSSKACLLGPALRWGGSYACFLAIACAFAFYGLFSTRVYSVVHAFAFVLW